MPIRKKSKTITGKAELYYIEKVAKIAEIFMTKANNAIDKQIDDINTTVLQKSTLGEQPINSDIHYVMEINKRKVNYLYDFAMYLIGSNLEGEKRILIFHAIAYLLDALGDAKRANIVLSVIELEVTLIPELNAIEDEYKKARIVEGG